MPLYKATCSISWNFEHDGNEEDATARAKKLLKEKLAELGIDYRLLRVKKDRATRKNVVLGVFAIEDVLPHITQEETRRDYTVGDKTYSVRMNSQRYFVFKESLSCACCGLTGTHFILEQNPSDQSPHFNLYGKEDGKLVLFTKDHIIPSSLGGPSTHENYHTFCSICNNLKGNSLLTPADVKSLRSIYNENVRTASRRDLHKLMEAEREKLISSKTML